MYTCQFNRLRLRKFYHFLYVFLGMSSGLVKTVPTARICPLVSRKVNGRIFDPLITQAGGAPLFAIQPFTGG
jgi:hypothetical protein